MENALRDLEQEKDDLRRDMTDELAESRKEIIDMQDFYESASWLFDFDDFE